MEDKFKSIMENIRNIPKSTAMIEFEKCKVKSIQAKIDVLQWLENEMKPYKAMYAIMLDKLQKEFEDDIEDTLKLYTFVNIEDNGKTKEDRDGVELRN